MRHERQPTILVVEDNADEEAMVMRAIRRGEFLCQTVVAHSAEEALDYLHSRGAFRDRERKNPDVIVTDLRLSGQGGGDLVEHVRSDPTTRLIPIVVLTGSATDKQVEEIYLKGANSFLEKPVDFDEFTNAVSRIARYWGSLNTTPSGAASRSFPFSL